MNHDIIIIGAGIAGLTTACALAQKTQLSIAIVDAKPLTPTWSAASYHHRVSAMALSSKRIFQNMDVWQSIVSRRISAFNKIAVWNSPTQAKVEFHAAEVGEPQLGYIVENNVMQDALLSRLQDFTQVKIYAPVSATKIVTQDNHIELHADNMTYKAQLMVAADGANSWARQMAGIQVSAQDYGHDAIVATVRTESPHGRVARQVFLENGPLAFLPLDDANLSSIVWSMPPEHAQNNLQLSDEEFQTKLAEAFGHHLGEVVEVSKRFSFPLKKQRAERYVSQRIALIADAAHTVHPLAGQGLNIGLLDAAALVDVIIDAIRHNRDYCHHTSLRRYERWRKGENTLMLSGIDSIKSIFCSSKQTSNAVRSFSLNITEQLPLLKNLFMSRAIGAHDGLPTLARPSL